MKIRRSIFWFIVIVAILIVLLLWFGKGKQMETAPTVSTATSAPLAATVQSAPVSAAVRTNATFENASEGTILSKSPPQSKTEQTARLLSTYNDVPINFYGKVEDQFSNAVDNATINFSIRVINGQESTVKRDQVMTDGNGLFSITGYRGQDLSLVPQKTGYVLAATATLFNYSHLGDRPYVPDGNNPTVIKMWKLRGAEPLAEINKTFKLSYAGAPIFVDLMAGSIVTSGGDLEIIITRAPGVITQQNHGDWSIKLVPVNGGIIETDYQTAQVTFEAPASGYQSTYLVQMNHDDPAWFDNIQKVFFMTSRSGQVYSKFSLDFGINDDPNGTMWLQFKGAANANSSRNWEGTAPQ